MTIETELARARESVMQSFSEIEFQRSTFDGRTQKQSQSTSCQAVVLELCNAKAKMKRKAGADDGIRTRDLRFTKPLLYQLSYVGKCGRKHCIAARQ